MSRYVLSVQQDKVFIGDLTDVLAKGRYPTKFDTVYAEEGNFVCELETATPLSSEEISALQKRGISIRPFQYPEPWHGGSCLEDYLGDYENR